MQAAFQVPDFLHTPTQIIETTYNLYCNPQGKRRLPDDFQPGPYDVLCARGKKAHDHPGNVGFRALVERYQDEYANCTSKHEKSKIVSFIVNHVRQAAAHHKGGFVKNSDGLWFEVGDRAAKEKIGQTFRDLLHTKYSSSTKAKAIVRVQRRVEEYKQMLGEEESKQYEPEPLHIPPPSAQSSTIPMGMPSITIPPLSSITVPSLHLNPLKSLRDHMSPRFSVRPDRPFSDSAVLEQLRSSVQTVERSEPFSMRMSTSTLELPTDEEWLKLSLRDDDDVNDLQSPKPTVTPSIMVPPRQIDDIVEAYMQDASTPYGIFSSSTRSHPFSSSSISTGSGNSNGIAKRHSLVSNSSGSRYNPLLVESTRSSFMNMDLDPLFTSMDSLTLLNALVE